MNTNSDIPFAFTCLCAGCGKPFGEHSCMDNACPAENPTEAAPYHETKRFKPGAFAEAEEQSRIMAGEPEALKGQRKTAILADGSWPDEVDRITKENRAILCRVAVLQRRVTWFLSLTEDMLSSEQKSSILDEIGRDVPKEHCTAHDIVFQGECPDCAHFANLFPDEEERP